MGRSFFIGTGEEKTVKKRDRRRRKWALWGLLLGACWMVATPFGRWLAKPETAALITYLETGRVVKLQLTPPEPEETEPVPAGTLPGETAPEKPVFAPEELQGLAFTAAWDCSVDPEAMALSPLQWDLTQPGPRVLILHSHTTESYTQTPREGYVPTAPWRTLDPEQNMLRVGQALREALEELGIEAVLATTVHDYPDYNSAYIRSRETVQAHLQAYPGVQLVLDLHRDASDGSSGSQLSTALPLEGRSTARLMLVVGSDAGGRVHPDWEENMALAVKLQLQLERLCPGITRPIQLRTERFNQDLLPGMLLVEVGAAGDTLREALAAVEVLAQAIGELALGTG